jgi:hypothetical protein
MLDRRQAAVRDARLPADERLDDESKLKSTRCIPKSWIDPADGEDAFRRVAELWRLPRSIT